MMGKRPKWVEEKKLLEAKYGCPVDDEGNPIKTKTEKPKEPDSALKVLKKTLKKKGKK